MGFKKKIQAKLIQPINTLFIVFCIVSSLNNLKTKISLSIYLLRFSLKALRPSLRVEEIRYVDTDKIKKTKNISDN